MTITGRLKDIIIRKGENISAKEVEDLLYAHPKVADVAVIGLPDADSGERGVRGRRGRRRRRPPIAFDEMVGSSSTTGLIDQKMPEQLEIVDALPRNPSGKIVKAQLQQQFSG